MMYFLLILALACSSTGVNADEYNSTVTAENHLNQAGLNDERILSRKRRYLIFPDGSSLQLVFDEIIPIVDYTNYLILGVTVSLAWALPSEPPSEQLENVREKLNEGTPLFRKDENVNDLQYIDKVKIGEIKEGIYSKPAKQYNYYDFDRKVNKFEGDYYKSNDADRFNDVNRKYTAYNYPKIMKNYKLFGKKYSQKSPPIPWTSWKKMDDRQDDGFRYLKPRAKYNHMKYPVYKTASKIIVPTAREDYHPHHHRIYPVFGKRSTDSDFSMEEKLHLEYHRSSRDYLYSKIIKYFNGQGKDGEQCILQLLCAFGQRSNETEPGSFAKEILRAVFSFPQLLTDDGFYSPRYKRYNRAYSHESNCSVKFSQCDFPRLFDNLLF